MKKKCPGTSARMLIGLTILLINPLTVLTLPAAETGPLRAVYDLNWQVRYYLKDNALFGLDWQVRYYLRDDSVYDRRWIKRYYVKENELYDWDWQLRYYIRDYRASGDIRDDARARP